MITVAQKLKDRFYKPLDHPAFTYERRVEDLVSPDDTLLDAGCGRGAPVLATFAGKARELIGVDLEESIGELPGIRYVRGDLAAVPLPDSSVDVVMSRAVVEHLEHPHAVFCEMARLLRPGGHFVFLTPNLWDYASIISMLVPNRMHGAIVSRTEGRANEDVFPAHYRANTYRAIRRLAAAAGFHIAQFEWLGQYPSYFMFSRPLFILGTAYDKLVTRFDSLRFLRGWLLADLVREGAPDVNRNQPSSS